jgi:hypothetical protein
LARLAYRLNIYVTRMEGVREINRLHQGCPWRSLQGAESD